VEKMDTNPSERGLEFCTFREEFRILYGQIHTGNPYNFFCCISMIGPNYKENCSIIFVVFAGIIGIGTKWQTRNDTCNSGVFHDKSLNWAMDCGFRKKFK
jgi:hypothetical protein